MVEFEEEWRKAIPKERDRRQSEALTWVVGVLLGLAAIAPLIGAIKLGLPLWPLRGPLIFSSIFAALVWVLRAATRGGVAMGWVVCFILAQSPEVWAPFSSSPSRNHSLPALIALFALTFLATRLGRTKKEIRGLAEGRRGRRASQIAANLGIAAIFAAAGRYAGCIAALAEAAADTVSSEIGQAVGGPTVMITTLQPVPSGADGGVSVAGTLAGIIAAAVIAAIGGVGPALFPHWAAVAIAACSGLLFDSVLGATIERRGWIGNDLVNFLSTLSAAVIAETLARQ